MYSGLLQIHSYLRYFVLVLLILVIIISLVGWFGKKPYTRRDDKVSLFLLICTHTQALIGIILYIVSLTNGHRVQFNSETMKNPALRYFAVEHITAMIITVVLITVARAGAKKLAVDQAKHKRLVILNSIALAIILIIIYGAGRAYNTY